MPQFPTYGVTGRFLCPSLSEPEPENSTGDTLAGSSRTGSGPALPRPWKVPFEMNKWQNSPKPGLEITQNFFPASTVHLHSTSSKIKFGSPLVSLVEGDLCRRPWPTSCFCAKLVYNVLSCNRETKYHLRWWLHRNTVLLFHWTTVPDKTQDLLEQKRNWKYLWRIIRKAPKKFDLGHSLNVYHHCILRQKFTHDHQKNLDKFSPLKDIHPWKNIHPVHH